MNNNKTYVVLTVLSLLLTNTFCFPVSLTQMGTFSGPIAGLFDQNGVAVDLTLLQGMQCFFKWGNTPGEIFLDCNQNLLKMYIQQALIEIYMVYQTDNSYRWGFQVNINDIQGMQVSGSNDIMISIQANCELNSAQTGDSWLTSTKRVFAEFSYCTVNSNGTFWCNTPHKNTGVDMKLCPNLDTTQVKKIHPTVVKGSGFIGLILNMFSQARLVI